MLKSFAFTRYQTILTISEGYARRLLSKIVQREIGLKFKESGAKISHNSSKIPLRSTVSKQAGTLSYSRDVKRKKYSNISYNITRHQKNNVNR